MATNMAVAILAICKKLGLILVSIPTFLVIGNYIEYILFLSEHGEKQYFNVDTKTILSVK